ncbi:ras di-ras and rheb family members of small gtpase superfamily [Anaeramoeba flamelloides]|uniref:Ras di-ras and rheb family members of small gtpase superfamily n=1 Tax=Anaeramoeba flamelloides TaxID=1746091 RepID=A0AAV7YK86_9EUKA|nr:ras di-ras and rheb family members of small gtpase superfamily [Anaeramoeba flamelloides]
MDEQDKIMILGDSKVGKTTFRKSVQNSLLCDIDEEWDKTYNKLLELEDRDYFLGIVEMLRQEPLDSMFDQHIFRFNYFILMYSVTCRRSLKKVKQFQRKIKTKGSRNLKYVLLANKVDFGENTKGRKISRQEGEELSRQYDCPYFECSLKTKENLETTFVNILHYFTIMKEKISHEDLVEDFQHLLERQEFCDHAFQLQNNKQIGVHRLILECKLKVSLETIQEVLLTITPRQAKKFLSWAYCGYTNPSNFANIQNICQKLDLDYFNLSGVNNLVSDLQELRENEKTTDFTLKIGKTSIKTHKLILAARSDLFRGFFLSCEKSTNQVNDYSRKSSVIIENLINFFYTNQIPKTLKKNTSLELLELIDYYQLNLNSSLNSKLCITQKNTACSLM